MEGKKLLHSITLKNLLSFGSEQATLDLEPLNVLIGPNASGKSNLIEAISLLAATPGDLLKPFKDGGSFGDWFWKGSEARKAEIVVVLEQESFLEEGRLSYLLEIRLSGTRLFISAEVLRAEDIDLFSRTPTEAKLRTFDGGEADVQVNHQKSVLSQIRDFGNYPDLTEVGKQFDNIRFFRGWPLGRGGVLRKPQEVNAPDDFLLEDGSNLGLILNGLQNRSKTKRLILEKLRLVYEAVEDVTTKVQTGTIQIFFHEEGLVNSIPAARLSDGTLHYLCLLTILLHPSPPPLICIEEPELGLHPDIIPHVADLLLDASKRTQLIVTTHSETLVSRLSEVPESVVVCERDDQGTHLRRLDPEKLRVWLDKYSLGELWAKGEIGGNRW
jgi:predicted ATPase